MRRPHTLLTPAGKIYRERRNPLPFVVFVPGHIRSFAYRQGSGGVVYIL
jgi:hypothetical protein